MAKTKRRAFLEHLFPAIVASSSNTATCWRRARFSGARSRRDFIDERVVARRAESSLSIKREPCTELGILQQFHCGPVLTIDSLGNGLIEQSEGQVGAKGLVKCRERLGGMLKYYYRSFSISPGGFAD